MQFIELVRRVQDACSEPQASVAIGAPAGSLDEKFTNYCLRAVRQGTLWTDWPWDIVESAVTATASPTLFTLDPTQRKIVTVLYNGTPLNTQLTYDDLRVAYASQLDTAPASTPLYAALKDDSTLFLWPAPPSGSTNLIVVRGYRTPVVPTADTDVLAGPDAYHDALVQLAVSYAVREHFGNVQEANNDFAKAQTLFRTVSVGYRKTPARPRWRY